MKERHTISWNCFTSFSFLMPISLINLLLQQWVKGIMLLSFFFMQDPMAEITEMNSVPSAKGKSWYRYIRWGDRDEARERWRKNCSKWGCFQNTSLSIKVMWLRRYLDKGRHQYTAPCYVFFQVHCRLWTFSLHLVTWHCQQENTSSFGNA